jgi:predicted PurR-regulated permease PerM
LNQSIEKIIQGSIDVLKSALLGLKEAILFFIICPIYVFFMLLYRRNIHDFYLEFFHRRGYGIGPIILNEIKEVLQEYLKGLFFVVLIVAFLTSIGLLALGIKYALFIGLLSGILTLIPFVGVILSALIPMLLAYFTKDSLWYPVLVLVIYAIVQFLEGNFITPKIMGNKVNVNPLVIIISLVIMGALAGIVGIILTVPFLAMAKVIIDHSSDMKPWKYLMEETPSKRD